MNDELTISCDVALEALQSRLDGSAQPADPALSRHLRQCDECRARFAAADLLLAVYTPRVTPDFTVRLHTAIRRDSRHRKYRAWAVSAVALAAAIMLAIWFTQSNDSIPIVPNQGPVVAKVPSLERRISDARTAVFGFGGQTVGLFGIPDISAPRMDAKLIGQSLEPVASALTDAGKGVAQGMEPLTTSAKRAANRFWRDLPTTSNSTAPEKNQ